MKLYILVICVSAQILLASSRILHYETPENDLVIEIDNEKHKEATKFPQFCPKSTPKYNECMRNVLHELGPILIKGVREINFPRLDPLEVTSFSINRTLNEFVSLAIQIKELKNWGYDQMRLENFELDPETLEGNLHVIGPVWKSKMNFDMEGNILGLTLDSAGLLTTKLDNFELNFTFKLKRIERVGVEYFTFEKFSAKSTFDDADIDLLADNPEFQPTVDAIINFYNRDHKPLRDAIDPIYQEAIEIFYKSLGEKILENIPAKELIPE